MRSTLLFPLLIAAVSLATLEAQPTVMDFGAVGDGVADDSAAFAQAIQSLTDSGGALRIPKGIYNLGKTGIVIPKTFGGIRLLGDSAESSKLLYSGGGAAIQIGAPDGFTYGHTISDVEIDITQAGTNAVCIQLYPSMYIALIRVHLTSNNGFAPVANQQMGIVATGGNSANKLFGAYLRIEDARIDGRFRKGIYFTAAELGWGFNSCVLQGGAIVFPGAPVEGTIGIHLEQGNTNVITLLDVEQYDAGIQSDAYANSFISSRTEGNNVGLILAAPGNGTTGGTYNKVVAAFHSDGLINRSSGSQIIATDIADATSAASRKANLRK